MKPPGTVRKAASGAVATHDIGTRQGADALQASPRPPLLRTRAQRLDANAIGNALSNAVPKLIEVGMQEMKIAVGNDYLHTRGMSDCCALILCTNPHPLTGRFAQRALYHVHGAINFGTRGLQYIDEMIAMARGATRGARLVVCFGGTPVSTLSAEMILNVKRECASGKTRHPFLELRAECDDFFIVQADEIQVTPAGDLYTRGRDTSAWRPSDA